MTYIEPLLYFTTLKEKRHIYAWEGVSGGKMSKTDCIRAIRLRFLDPKAITEYNYFVLGKRST